ncbi:MAG: peptidylprolyl isomerase [Dehalococcoidales bacterium]|jgi:peptidylprolyl isomerase|nr:peptidylprolyl isomerase [Dehalococcoidales bacterium]MDD3264356.1 peptidylprolyl isomerase [Dehalococcoidales bacterium]MDD4322122.1 peptidylprolyl isomerase [Dehalococcoidales bacterium]MDD4793692.1 peptidylprolyl isomerase [Dehalococcoidales bacterium]MDD5122020.1 peptidylprolyl isomerase [Dehalococcoidales bacterium]
MVTAQNGETVKVHYTGMFSDGQVFDSSINREPLEFTIGEGSVIPGFDSAIVGMKVGENKTITIPCAEAYGERNDNAIATIDRSQLPEGLEPSIGQQLSASRPDGTGAIVTITKVEENTITVDGNHPLAGKDLTFDLTLVGIK